MWSKRAWSYGITQHSAIRPCSTRKIETVRHWNSLPPRLHWPEARMTARSSSASAPWTVIRNVASDSSRRREKWRSTHHWRVPGSRISTISNRRDGHGFHCPRGHPGAPHRCSARLPRFAMLVSGGHHLRSALFGSAAIPDFRRLLKATREESRCPRSVAPVRRRPEAWLNEGGLPELHFEALT